MGQSWERRRLRGRNLAASARCTCGRVRNRHQRTFKVHASTISFSDHSLQDHWFNAIAQFSDMLAAATEIGADHLMFHVFVHKMETLATENKTSAFFIYMMGFIFNFEIAKFNDIQRRINDEIEDQNIQNSTLARTLAFHATSVYDHTIYEAFSDVVMGLIPSDTLGQYENLLNSLHLVSTIIKIAFHLLLIVAQSCSARYAFLFDSRACLRVSANHETHESPTFSLSVEYLKLLAAMANVIGDGYDISLDTC